MSEAIELGRSIYDPISMPAVPDRTEREDEITRFLQTMVENFRRLQTEAIRVYALLEQNAAPAELVNRYNAEARNLLWQELYIIEQLKNAEISDTDRKRLEDNIYYPSLFADYQVNSLSSGPIGISFTIYDEPFDPAYLLSRYTRPTEPGLEGLGIAGSTIAIIIISILAVAGTGIAISYFLKERELAKLATGARITEVEAFITAAETCRSAVTPEEREACLASARSRTLEVIERTRLAAASGEKKSSILNSITRAIMIGGAGWFGYKLAKGRGWVK